MLLVLWAGSLWSLLWISVLLFQGVGDRRLAGALTGKFLSAETYLGIGVVAAALLLPGRTKFLWGYLAAALLAVNEWPVRHVLAVARARGAAAGLTFGAWHGVSAAIYLAACASLALLVWKQDFR